MAEAVPLSTEKKKKAHKKKTLHVTLQFTFQREREVGELNAIISKLCEAVREIGELRQDREHKSREDWAQASKEKWAQDTEEDIDWAHV